jgi:allantoin racemase
VRLLLVNPNTRQATTEAMLDIARVAAPGVVVEGLTAPYGVPLITNAAQLARAAEAVTAALAASPPLGFDGVIVAAFGDPGLAALRDRLPIPVTGIAEAGMAEAARHGAFAVVTTTPDLVEAIARRAEAYGHGDRFLGTVLTEGEVGAVMADQDRLVAALRAACLRAIDATGAKALVIGGGPLAVAARAIAGEIPVPVIEPVPAAMRLAQQRALPASGRASPASARPPTP